MVRKAPLGTTGWTVSSQKEHASWNYAYYNHYPRVFDFNENQLILQNSVHLLVRNAMGMCKHVREEERRPVLVRNDYPGSCNMDSSLVKSKAFRLSCSPRSFRPRGDSSPEVRLTELHDPFDFALRQQNRRVCRAEGRRQD